MKHILFDIDDTLFPSTRFSSLARKNALNAMISMGISADYGELDRRLEQIIKKKGSNYPKHFDELCKELKIKSAGKYVAAAVAAYHDTKTSIAPFPGVALTLMELKKQGHILHIATNGSSVKQWDKLIRLGLALYFDNVFVSEEIGTEKGVTFYKRILKSLDVPARSCIMVGDREDADIDPAKKVGMRTIRLLQGKYAKIPSKADHKIQDISKILSIMQQF